MLKTFISAFFVNQDIYYNNYMLHFNREWVLRYCCASLCLHYLNRSEICLNFRSYYLHANSV